jgi:hypothetical protein
MGLPSSLATCRFFGFPSCVLCALGVRFGQASPEFLPWLRHHSLLLVDVRSHDLRRTRLSPLSRINGKAENVADPAEAKEGAEASMDTLEMLRTGSSVKADLWMTWTLKLGPAAIGSLVIVLVLLPRTASSLVGGFQD